jgi:hypothetical protein
MISLYTESEYQEAKALDKLSLRCYVCEKIFFKEKRVITRILKNQNGHSGKCCSKICQNNLQKKSQIVTCLSCLNNFEKTSGEIKRHPNHFCSKSCSATYHNKNKKYGTNRSKLEIYLETKLSELYPNLKIDYNQTKAINSELDIYIPLYKLAFELNGIFHYEPIFGLDKLNKIQETDSNKFQKCIENDISLCVIDTSSQKYFKESTSKKYLDIIVNIINQRTSC